MLTNYLECLPPLAHHKPHPDRLNLHTIKWKCAIVLMCLWNSLQMCISTPYRTDNIPIYSRNTSLWRLKLKELQLLHDRSDWKTWRYNALVGKHAIDLTWSPYTFLSRSTKPGLTLDAPLLFHSSIQAAATSTLVPITSFFSSKYYTLIHAYPKFRTLFKRSKKKPTSA